MIVTLKVYVEENGKRNKYHKDKSENMQETWRGMIVHILKGHDII